MSKKSNKKLATKGQAVEEGPPSEFEADKNLSLLDWGKKYLPEHFAEPPSAMHVWLGEQLDEVGKDRGGRINVIGPRGSAKSTLVTFAYVLRAALENREQYIWIVSDTGDQARIHLDNLRSELDENERLRGTYKEVVEHGQHVVTGVAQALRERRWVHLIEEEAAYDFRRRRLCWAAHNRSSRSATSVLLATRSSISSG